MANILSRRNLFRGAAGAALGALAASRTGHAEAAPLDVAITPSVGELVVAELEEELHLIRMNEALGASVLDGVVTYDNLPYLFAAHFGPPPISYTMAEGPGVWISASDDGETLVELEQTTEITIDLGEVHFDLGKAADLEAWLNSPSHVHAFTLR